MMKYFGLPVLASKHGADVDRLVVYIHLLMALLFVGAGGDGTGGLADSPPPPPPPPPQATRQKASTNEVMAEGSSAGIEVLIFYG